MPESKSTEIRIFDLIRLFKQKRGLILSNVFFATLLSVIYSLIVTPQFESEGLLKPVKASTAGLIGNTGGLLENLGTSSSLAALMSSLSPDINEAIATIESQSFTRDLLLNDRLIEYIYQDQWDKEKKEWTSGEDSIIGVISGWYSSAVGFLSGDANGNSRPSGPEGYDGPSLDKAVLEFDRLRTTALDRRTGFIRLSVRWEDPEIARQWVELIVKRLNERLRSQEIRETDLALVFLEDRLREEAVEPVRERVARLYEQQLQRKMMLESRTDHSLRFIDRPFAPETRAFPSRKAIVLGTFLVSFVIACFMVIFLYFYKYERERYESNQD